MKQGYSFQVEPLALYGRPEAVSEQPEQETLCVETIAMICSALASL